MATPFAINLIIISLFLISSSSSSTVENDQITPPISGYAQSKCVPVICRNPHPLLRPYWCRFIPDYGHHHHQICKSVTHLLPRFFIDVAHRGGCCRDIRAINDDCLRRNMDSTIANLLPVMKGICADFDSGSPPEEPKSKPSSTSPPPAAAQPSPKPSPPPASPIKSPPPKQTPSSPSPPPISPPKPSPPPQTPSNPKPSPSPQHQTPPPISTPPAPKLPFPPKSTPPPSSPSPTLPNTAPDGKRPANCLVSTVLYDSCDPKYPATGSNGSTEERNYYPQNLSTGFITDGAGCCLGFALFTNDCNAAIMALSFANQKVFTDLQRACRSPLPKL